MKNSWDIIFEIESDNGKLFKQGVVEREALADNLEFFAGLKLALHPLTTFGVKQVPMSTVASDVDQQVDFPYFFALCSELMNRNLTGHAARDAIHDMMLECSQAQWDNWYRRILIQDMRAGFSESTVNKAVKEAKTPKFAIPVFKCMLAHDGAKHEKKIKGKKQIDIKLDGVRLLSILRPGEVVKQFSRNGKPLVNFGHICTQLTRMANDFDEPMVLDGEIMSSSFQDLMTQVNRQSNVDAGDAVLNVFDIIPLSEFEAGIGTKTQTERTAYLQQIEDKYGDSFALWFGNVHFLKSEVVDLDTVEGKARMAEINKKALDGGYEGIMMKDVDALYHCKRSAHWLKVKPYIEVSLTVVEVEEGTGKNVGKMGALVCEGVDDGVNIRVNVGSGFSDKQRKEYFTNDLVGQVVEVKADAVTKSRDSDTYSLRFPRFQCFRGFEKGEKL